MYISFVVKRFHISKWFSCCTQENQKCESRYILCDDVVGDGPVEGPHLLALKDDGGWRGVETKLAPQLDRRGVLDAGRAVPVVLLLLM